MTRSLTIVGFALKEVCSGVFPWSDSGIIRTCMDLWGMGVGCGLLCGNVEAEKFLGKWQCLREGVLAPHWPRADHSEVGTGTR